MRLLIIRLLLDCLIWDRCDFEFRYYRAGREPLGITGAVNPWLLETSRCFCIENPIVSQNLWTFIFFHCTVFPCEFRFTANILQANPIKLTIFTILKSPISCRQTICPLDIQLRYSTLLFRAVWRMSETNHYAFGRDLRCETLLISSNDWWVPLGIVRKHWKHTKSMGTHKTCNASNNVILLYSYNT